MLSYRLRLRFRVHALGVILYHPASHLKQIMDLCLADCRLSTNILLHFSCTVSGGIACQFPCTDTLGVVKVVIVEPQSARALMRGAEATGWRLITKVVRLRANQGGAENNLHNPVVMAVLLFHPSTPPHTLRDGRSKFLAHASPQGLPSIRDTGDHDKVERWRNRGQI